MKLQPGVRFGSYEISSKLGAGGMGEVYLARDERLGRMVALKLLLPAFTASRDHLLRFAQEAKAASALNHPNVLTIYEIGRVDSISFIASEFVDGETLRGRIANGERLALPDALDIASQVASGLAAAHDAGVIHRDIKPENIMIRRDGFVKVVDFGLAKLAHNFPARIMVGPEESTVSVALTNSGAMVGTVTYMSPEQLRGAEVDARVDIWSLGCVLYEMLTGHSPFKGASAADVIAAILDRDPPALDQSLPMCPPEIVHVIAKALAKDRDERYQTARDLLNDLREVARRIGMGSGMSGAVIGSLAPPALMSAEVGRSSPGTARDTSAAPRDQSTTEILAGNRKWIFVIGILLVMLLGGYSIYRYKLVARDTPQVRPLAMNKLVDTGNAIDAAVSPDGKYVAYVLEEPGTQSLWGQQVGAESNAWPIVERSAQRFWGLTFSPDGNYIFYVVFDRALNAYVLYQTPALGGVPRRIIEDVDTAVTFSPDGKQLAFIRGYPQKNETAIVVANVDGSGQRVLASRKSPDDFGWQAGPSWSPDGELIACPAGRYEDEMNLVAVRVNDGTETTISAHPWSWIGRVAWLGNDQGLLMVAKDKTSSPPQIWHMTYPDGEAKRVTADLSAYNFKSLSVTNDSQSLVAVQTNHFSSIWTQPENNPGGARRLTATKSDGYDGLSWTPDGRLVFVSTASGSKDIWLMSANGENRKQITSGNTVNFQPTVTPDGRYIVFVSTRGGGQDLWRIDLDGNGLKQMTFGLDADWPDSSPDGQWVVFKNYVSGKKTIWKINIDGGTPIQLTDRYSDWPAVSPDGKEFVCEFWDEQPGTRAGLAIVPIEGGKPLRFLDFPPAASGVLNVPNNLIRWSPDGKAIDYLDGRSGVSNIIEQPVDGSPPKPVTLFDSDRIFWFDWSHDGKSLAYARGTVTSDVVLIKLTKE